MSKQALIIDDNLLNLETLSLLLRKEGFEPITLSSPRDLESLLAAEPEFAVVFLDLEFPNHDGFDILPILKAHPVLDAVPIVAYTVHISEQTEARAAGFHSFIGKPLDVERFPEQLRLILSGEDSVWDVGQ